MGEIPNVRDAAAGRSIDGTARHKADESVIPLSAAGISIRDYVRQAPEARKPVGYDRKFLDRYRPNVSFYLTEQDRARLAAVGRPQIADLPAGTYARQILNRLLIDLAWNSSRLEGNTYSRLDTKRLIELACWIMDRTPRGAPNGKAARTRYANPPVSVRLSTKPNFRESPDHGIHVHRGNRVRNLSDQRDMSADAPTEAQCLATAGVAEPLILVTTLLG